MIDLINTNPLSDFTLNADEHIARLRASGEPEVLTINGEAAVVVQDAGAYQELRRKAEYSDTVQAIRDGVAAHERGDGVPMREALEALASEAGFSLKS